MTKAKKIDDVEIGDEVVTRFGWAVVVTGVAVGPNWVHLTCSLGRDADGRRESIHLSAPRRTTITYVVPGT